MKKKEEICIVRIGTDDPVIIKMFKEAWDKAKVDRVLYVPVDVKFVIKGVEQ